MDTGLILSCLQENWVWQLGDNHPLGWSLTAGYALAAVMTALVAARGGFPADTRLRERAFWTVVALALIFLAVNKQLNLQTTLRLAGRCIAQAEGWYQTRDTVQRQFVLALTAGLSVTGLLILWWLRRTLWRNLPVLAGGLVLAAFIALRAADIGNLRHGMQWQFLQIPAERWSEAVGIALIVIGAAFAWRRGRRRGRRE